MYLSYVTAFDFNIKLIGTNGIFEIYNNKAELFLGHKKILLLKIKICLFQELHKKKTKSLNGNLKKYHEKN
jgi:hypothetical protein